MFASPHRRDAFAIGLALVIGFLGARAARAQTGVQKLTGPPVAGARFGADVAVGTDLVAVGAPGVDSVYLYTWNGSTWVSAGAPLTGNAGSGFGTSVCIDGPWLLVGAPHDDAGATVDAGAVDVWLATSPGTYAHHSALNDSVPQTGAQFGFDVDFDGTTCIVGAPLANASAGRVVRFALNGANQFVFAQAMTSVQTTAGDQFGHSVAVDGATMVIGAPFDDLGGGNVDNGGAAFYRKVGNAWTAIATSYYNSPVALNQGWSVACDGDHVVVGRPCVSIPDNMLNFIAGHTLYEWNGTTYAFVSYTNTGSNAHPGQAVCIDDHRIVRTAPRATAFSFVSPFGPHSGDFFLYRVDGNDFLADMKVSGEVSSYADPLCELGTSCALSGAWLAVGADGDDAAAMDAGSVFVYDATLLAYRSTYFAAGSAGIASSSYGMPVLRFYGSFAANDPLVVRLSGVKPNAPVILIAGLTLVNAPFHSGTLGPSLDLILPVLFSSAAGVLELPAAMPPGLPADTRLYLQALIQDGAALQGIAASPTDDFVTPY